jgi:hypothetical protein
MLAGCNTGQPTAAATTTLCTSTDTPGIGATRTPEPTVGPALTPTPEPVAITVNFTFVKGSTATSAVVERHLAEANTIFNPHQIFVAKNTMRTLSHSESLVIGDDFVFDDPYDGPLLFALNEKSAPITVYYVSEMHYLSTTAVGYGYKPEELQKMAGANPEHFGVILSDKAIDHDNALAHEIGHVCGLKHVDDSRIDSQELYDVSPGQWEDNLMYSLIAPTRRDFTGRQAAEMRYGFQSLKDVLAKVWSQ